MCDEKSLQNEKRNLKFYLFLITIVLIFNEFQYEFKRQTPTRINYKINLSTYNCIFKIKKKNAWTTSRKCQYKDSVKVSGLNSYFLTKLQKKKTEHGYYVNIFSLFLPLLRKLPGRLKKKK